ncbi:hypothetical protein ADMFC3_12780 [Geovibrio sp. ADMFC3]
MAINLHVDFSGITDEVDRDKLNLAIARSLNRAADSVRSNLPKQVRDIYDIKLNQSEIKSMLSVQRATPSRRAVYVRGSGQLGVSLTKYYGAKIVGIRQKARSRKAMYANTGVSYKITKAKGRQKTRNKQGYGWFVAQMKSGYEGIFRRAGYKTSKGKEALEVWHGPGLGRILSHRNIEAFANAHMVSRFDTEFTRYRNYQRAQSATSVYSGGVRLR